MKGNEARVVFFLHPVDQLKDGQVSKVQPLLRRSFVVTVFLLLGLLLGLGVLVFVLLQFGVETRSQQEPLTTTEVPFNTTTESPVTERTGERERGTHAHTDPDTDTHTEKHNTHTHNEHSHIHKQP